MHLTKETKYFIGLEPKSEKRKIRFRRIGCAFKKEKTDFIGPESKSKNQKIGNRKSAFGNGGGKADVVVSPKA